MYFNFANKISHMTARLLTTNKSSILVVLFWRIFCHSTSSKLPISVQVSIFRRNCYLDDLTIDNNIEGLL